MKNNNNVGEAVLRARKQQLYLDTFYEMVFGFDVRQNILNLKFYFDKRITSAMSVLVDEHFTTMMKVKFELLEIFKSNYLLFRRKEFTEPRDQMRWFHQRWEYTKQHFNRKIDFSKEEQLAHISNKWFDVLPEMAVRLADDTFANNDIDDIIERVYYKIDTPDEILYSSQEEKDGVGTYAIPDEKEPENEDLDLDFDQDDE